MAKKSRVKTPASETLFDKGTKAVEEIHLSIAHLPFQLLDRFGVLEKSGNEIKKLHDETVGDIYDTVREVARKVSDFSNELGDEIIGPVSRSTGSPASKRARATA